MGRITEAGHAFSLGIGWVYFISEMNIKIKQGRSGIQYANFLFGTLPSYFDSRFLHFGFFGSFGTSFASEISPSTDVQLSLDGLFHYGLNGEEIVQDIPEMYGLQAGVGLNKQISTHLFISINGGVAYQKYRYWQSFTYIFYSTWRSRSEWFSEQEGWQSHISFPFSIAAQLKF